MSVETIANKWHDKLLSTDPVDRERAEAAIRAVYRAAAMPEPKRFLWCASPLDAAWSALVLIGKDKNYNHAVYEDIERSKSGKDKLAKARASVAGRLGIGEEEVEGYFGKAFYRADDANPVSAKLQEGITDAWLARAEGGDTFLAPHAGGPFKPLHDLEQRLHFEGEVRGGHSLYRQALAEAGGKHLAILGGRSAQHRLYGSFAYISVAIDEALAEAGKFEPTELQRAMWAAYDECGLWWPCYEGVVLSERPIAADVVADGPRMEWSDGFTLGGKPDDKRIDPVASAPAAVAARPRVLDHPLPRDQAERISFLREQSSLPFLDRYLAGDHESVWSELIALGPEALSDKHAADALAVAYETMHRVNANVATIADRLKHMNYRFVYPGSEGGLFGLRKARAHEPHVAPPSDAFSKIAELEQTIGGPLPLSLRAFFELVGEVNFNGDHPSLAPAQSDLTPDPLMVCGVDDAIAMIESEDRDEDEPLTIDIAPDALHKANISGGGPYAIIVPDAAVDAHLDEEPNDVGFVAYLRIAILDWGGFPGWADSEGPRPPELDRLREGLVPF